MVNASSLVVGNSRKNSTRGAVLALAVMTASFYGGISSRADTYANNGGTTLNTPGSWIDLTNPGNTGIGMPGAADLAQFDSHSALAGATTFSLGSPTSWLGLLVTNPGAAITIDNGANPLTLGASGIDMSAAASGVTLGASQTIIGASQTWNVNTGQTLTVNSNVDTNGKVLTIAGGGTTVVNFMLQGTGSLVLSDTGVVTLGGGNSYTGNTTLNSGTVNFNTGSALGSGVLTINGGTINNTSGNAQFSSSNSQININGNFTYGGSQSMELTAPISLGATSTITVNGTGANALLTLDGVISGGFGLTKAGTGSLVLTGANTYTGPVGVNGGVLNFNSGAALGAGSAINFGGGTLQYTPGNGYDISARTVTFTGNATIDTNTNNVTFANSVGNGGAGGLTKTGTGTLVLAATNSYSGNTTVSGSNATAASVLFFPTLASLGSGSAININNGTLMYGPGISPDLTQRTVSVSGTLAAIDLNGNSVTYANPISGTGTLTLANSPGSPVTVNLNASNQYAGTLAANSGVTLVMGKVDTLAKASVTLNTGSALNFGNFTNVTLGGLGGAQDLVMANNLGQPVALTLGGNNQGGTYSGILSDNGANLSITKIGTGTQTLQTGSTFSGDTFVNGGTLQLDFRNSPATTTNILYNGLATQGRLVMSGATFTTTNKASTTNYQQFGSTVINSGASAITQQARQSNGHPAIYLYGISRNVGATVQFGANTGTGGTQTSTDTGIFTTNTNGPSGILGGWATNGTGEWARVNTSAGALPSSGTHIYGGATYTNSFANNTINTDMTANLTAPSGATTGSVRFNTAIPATLTTTGANVIATGGILVTPAAGLNVVSIVPADGSSTLTSGNGTDLIVIDYDTTAGGALNIQTPIVDNGGPIAFTKSGPGTVILSGANSFTGGVYLNEGVLQLGNAGALNAGAPNAVYFGQATSTSGTLTLGGNNATASLISTAGATVGSPVIQNASGTSAVLTVNGSSPSTFSGTIQNGSGSGSLGLTVGGAGGMTLSGTNTYTGNTTIQSGSKLILSAASNNISGSKNILVNSGATLALGGVTNGFTLLSGQTLSGSGTITGSLGLGAAAVLNPGTSGIGTLTTDGLALNPNSVVNLQFGSGVNDTVVVNNSGGLVLNGTAGSININLINVADGTPFATSGTYDLFQYAGAIGGTGLSALADANVPIGTQATFGTAVVGGNQFVTVTLAPSTIQLPTWNLSGGGSWNVASNWNPSGVPNAQGQTAVLGSSITAASTVTLDGAQTVGTIAFNNSNSYTVAAGTGGSLVLDNGVNPARIVGSLGSHTISAPVVLNSNLNASITDGSVALSGVVSEGSAGKSVTMNGAGTLILANANTYTGGTVLGSGTIQVGNDAALGTGSLDIQSSAKLQAGANVTLANNITVEPTTTATIDTQANTMTLTGVVSSIDTTATFNKTGAGTLVITGTNTFTGAVTVNGGTMQLGNGVTNGSFANASITTVNSTLAFNTVGAVTVANNITGSGGVVQNGNNTITLSGANTYSGGLNIKSGTVSLGTSTTNDGAGAGNITMANGTTLNMPGYNASTGPTYVTIPNNVVIADGATVTINNGPRGEFSGGVIGNGTLNFTVQYVRGAVSGDWSTFHGQLNLTATTPNQGTGPGGDFRINNGNFDLSGASVNVGPNVSVYTLITNGTVRLGDLTGNGTVGAADNNAATYEIGAVETAGQTSTFTGTLADATVGRATNVTKVGPGTLDLAGVSTFTGTVTVNAGLLTLAGSSSVPAQVNGLSVAAGGTLDIGGWNPTIVQATNMTSPGITGNGTIGSSSTSAPTLISYNQAVNSTFGGTIQDHILSGNQQVSLTVNAGNLTLAGANTYSGQTTINGGGLFVTNTTGSGTGSGNVTLTTGTLGGTGTISGAVTASGGTINPGVNTAGATGTLTVGSLAAGDGSTLNFDLAAPGTSNDLVAVTGNVSFGAGNITVGASPLTGAASLGYYEIMTYGGTMSGLSNMTVTLPTSADTTILYSLDSTTTAGVISVHKGYIGDANDDGTVDLTDLSIVLNNFGVATLSWSKGNFDGAATVNLTDLSDVLNRFGTSVATTSVSAGPSIAATPEPASLAIAVPAALMLMRRRRSR
ncbi:MAG: autotransporter-associated beta strand repeat-containing protein [Phycisphaerae bacterium]